MAVICGKHNAESRVTKIAGGVRFNCAECDIERSAPALLEALEEITEMYVAMINSGDCGNWNPEEDKEVIKARAAIKQARGE